MLRGHDRNDRDRVSRDHFDSPGRFQSIDSNRIRFNDLDRARLTSRIQAADCRLYRNIALSIDQQSIRSDGTILTGHYCLCDELRLLGSHDRNNSDRISCDHFSSPGSVQSIDKNRVGFVDRDVTGGTCSGQTFDTAANKDVVCSMDTEIMCCDPAQSTDYRASRVHFQ